jgi:YfiH family protein
VIDFLHPDFGAPASVRALSTLRRGGVSQAPYDDGRGGGGLNLGLHVGDAAAAVLQNRALLQEYLPAAPAWIEQVHGINVIDAAGVTGLPQADASVTDRRGVVCVVQTADCLPVLFCDVAGRAVGAAHAGWRGLAGGVLECTVARMRELGAGEIVAWMGPAIGPAQFEVGAEVRAAFVEHDAQAASAFVDIDGRSGKYLADIYALARQRLDALGGIRCHGGHFCTVTEVERFYSYRRESVTGRMASMIWIE